VRLYYKITLGKSANNVNNRVMGRQYQICFLSIPQIHYHAKFLIKIFFGFVSHIFKELREHIGDEMAQFGADDLRFSPVQSETIVRLP